MSYLECRWNPPVLSSYVKIANSSYFFMLLAFEKKLYVTTYSCITKIKKLNNLNWQLKCWLMICDDYWTCLGVTYYITKQLDQGMYMYRMSHRYWTNFSTWYLRLKSIFLSPDSNHMTHGTWQIDQHQSCRWILKITIIYWSFKNVGDFHLFFPKSVLGNLDPYSGTWTRTREPGPK